MLSELRFPRNEYLDDIHGQGTVGEFVRTVFQRGPLVEVRVVKDPRVGGHTGYAGILQYVDKNLQHLEMSVTAQKVNDSTVPVEGIMRANLTPECEIEWVIHPSVL